jgi:hypothetical protein
VPIGHAVNGQVAMLTGLSCHRDAGEARRRGLDGFRFFQFALAHYYAYGQHRPGRTDLWRQFVAVRDELGTEVLGGGTGCIGTPAEVTRTLEALEAAGVDQTIFIQQTGRTRHADICESLDLLATAVLPPFRERELAHGPARAAARAPHAEAALARKARRRALADEAIAAVPAYGLLPVDPATLPEANRRRLEVYRRMREIIDRTG